jgi:glycosyltransferase involved in cell wall biosynthesis
MVEAFHVVLKTFPEAHLTIIGDGPELGAIKAAAGDELDRHIHLTGATYNESEVAPHMNRADAFVMTGRVGLAINHALGYNLPVVCFQRTGNGPYHGSEIAHLREGVTGYEVKDYNSRLFGEKVVSLFQRMPDLKARHRDLIADYVSRNMSIDLMVSGFKAIDEYLRGTDQMLEAQAAQ